MFKKSGIIHAETIFTFQEPKINVTWEVIHFYKRVEWNGIEMDRTFCKIKKNGEHYWELKNSAPNNFKPSRSNSLDFLKKAKEEWQKEYGKIIERDKKIESLLSD